MEALIITIFVSMVLVFLALVFFAHCVRQGDFEHGDRLSLLPLEDEFDRSTTETSTKEDDSK